jgi:hypothetical protein
MIILSRENKQNDDVLLVDCSTPKTIIHRNMSILCIVINLKINIKESTGNYVKEF